MARPYTIESLFANYHGKIYRLALSISRNEKDAEDILQNTFLKIARSIGSFRRQSKISTWIYRIAYNEALMLLRKRKRQFKFIRRFKAEERSRPKLFVNWSKLPDELVLDKELKGRLDGALRHIDIKYRMPLLLHKVDGLPLKDTASVLRLNSDSLKSRLHRAQMMVRKEISEYFKDKEETANKKCGLLTKFVYDYARGALDKKRRFSFRRHIIGCPSCNSFLNAYRNAIRITKAIECHDLPFELQEKIKSFISQYK